MFGLVSFDARLTRPDSNTPHLSWLAAGTELGWLALPVAGGVGDHRLVRPVVVIFPGIRHATVGLHPGTYFSSRYEQARAKENSPKVLVVGPGIELGSSRLRGECATNHTTDTPSDDHYYL